MSNNSGKKLEENLEPIFNMHERFDEALYRANIKKERIIHLPFKQFIGILASCCLAFSATTVAITQCLKFNYNEIEINYNREDILLATNYFYDNNISFTIKNSVITYYINENLIFNSFNADGKNYYFQIYRIIETSKVELLNLIFICNNQSKSFNINVTQKNYIEKINDENFTISGDYYTCEIFVNNSFYKKIYLNL